MADLRPSALKLYLFLNAGFRVFARNDELFNPCLEVFFRRRSSSYGGQAVNSVTSVRGRIYRFYSNRSFPQIAAFLRVPQRPPRLTPSLLQKLLIPPEFGLSQCPHLTLW